MQVDFLTLACLRDQMDRLLGARVQQVLLVDERSIALELYAGERINLLASADPQAPRILVTPEKYRRGVEGDPPFLLLLRKWVRGAQLVDVTQPPWERILTLELEGRAGPCDLAVELVGRYSNITLVDGEGTVLEAVKHVDSTMSRYRTILPGHPYDLPPLPPNRRPPLDVGTAVWADLLSKADPDEPVDRWLVGQIWGVSPVAAREVAARLTGDPGATVGALMPEPLHAAIAELLGPLENGWWQPHVALDEAGRVIAFTPYAPKQFDRVEAVPDISTAMWRYFTAKGMTDPYVAARTALQTLIEKTRGRLDRRLAHMQESKVDEQQVQALREAGELLLTYQSRVKRGAGEVVVPDYAGEPRAISLDPTLTPVENAQAYFRRYDKAHRAAERLPRLIRVLKAEQAYLEQLEADLALAESRPEIDAVRDALAAAGWTSKRGRTGSLVSEPRRFEIGGLPIYVGRNARQNEQVTFQRAGPEDYWLHVRGLPGAHVVIKRGRQPVPEVVFERAARLAAYYSKARDSQTEVAVDVTERRFVHRVSGKFPGLVTYRNERTVFARPAAEDEA